MTTFLPLPSKAGKEIYQLLPAFWSRTSFFTWQEPAFDAAMSRLRDAQGLRPVSRVGNDLLHRAHVLLVDRAKGLRLLLRRECGVVENLLAASFVRLGHLVNGHDGLVRSAILHGRGLGLAVERVLDHQVILVALRADDFLDGGIALRQMPLALLLAEG